MPVYTRNIIEANTLNEMTYLLQSISCGSNPLVAALTTAKFSICFRVQEVPGETESQWLTRAIGDKLVSNLVFIPENIA